MESETAAKIFVITRLTLPSIGTATVAITPSLPIVTITIKDRSGIIAQETRSDTKIKIATKQIITRLSQQQSIGGEKLWGSFKKACQAKGWSVLRETKHPAFSTKD